MRFAAVVFLALFGVLATFPEAHASGLAVGAVEDGYAYMGSGYWKNQSTGDYATREKVYWGYYQPYGYSASYPKYYYWSYTPASAPASSLTPKSTDAEWIDFLKNRETIAGEISAAQQRDEAFLAKLKAVGVTPPFPGIPGYSGAAFNASYNKLGVVQGNTVFGYSAPYSYKQVVEVQNSPALDRLVLHQLVGVGIKNVGALLGDVTSQQSGLIAQEIELAKVNGANFARVAEIEAQGRADAEKLRILQPPARITTTINGTTVAPVDNAPYPMPQAPADGGQAFRALPKSEFVKSACISCHGAGGKPEGGLDLTKPLTQVQYLSVLNRISTKDESKRMPRTKDGAAGPQATLAQIRSLLD